MNKTSSQEGYFGEDFLSVLLATEGAQLTPLALATLEDHESGH
jgi:hypothetical protein